VSMDVARKTRESRSTWAIAFLVLAVAAAIVGYAGWHASEPSDGRKVVDALVQLQCAQDGNGCDHVAASSQPAWLYGGGGVAGVLVLVGLVLLATRPVVPARAWTDEGRVDAGMTPLRKIDF
jgi:uncharacterized membrane protein YtjA (UPF0391 family)